MPMTRDQLKELATTRKNKKDATARRKASEAARKHKEAVETCVRDCRSTMKAAAKKGKFYCEVDIAADIYNDVATSLADFGPHSNGDGYGKNVICLKWD